MSTVQARSAFDLQERTRIQRGLRRYMEQHGIGTPTLQLRIMEADAPRHRELPLSTLQRFITGSHRTSDAYVGMCQQFLESLGPQEEDAPEFGEALLAFLREPVPAEEQSALTALLAERLPGVYESRTKPITQGGDMPYPPETPLVQSNATFTPVPGRSYLHVQEFVRDHMNADRAPNRRYSYEGVLVSATPLIYIMLRDKLLRQLKIYMLTQTSLTESEENIVVLEGESYEQMPLFGTLPRMRLGRNNRVQFVPRREEESAP